MNKPEFSKFAMAMKTYYPKEQILPNAESMELWFQELCDIPFDLACAALRKWVALNKWSPSIAEIREICGNVVNGDGKTWADGWQLVQKSVQVFGYMNAKSAVDFIAKNDPIAADCVRKIGFTNICFSENSQIERSAFKNCYEIMQKRAKDDQILSIPLKDTLDHFRISCEINELKRLGN